MLLADDMIYRCMFCKAEVEGHIGLFGGSANHLHMSVLLTDIMDRDAFVRILIFFNLNPFQKFRSLQDGLPLSTCLAWKKGRCKQDKCPAGLLVEAAHPAACPLSLSNVLLSEF